MEWKIETPWLDFGQKDPIFLFSTLSILTLELPILPFGGYLGLFTGGKNGRAVKLATHLQVNAGAMNKRNYNSNLSYAFTACARDNFNPLYRYCSKPT
jgi:hypothetical protein